MWIPVNDYSVCLPSYKANRPILVTDGENVHIVGVRAFIENVDKPYCRWTHWMRIPSIDE